MLFLGVYNVMLHFNAATLRRLTSFILCLMGGEGSIASSRPKHGHSELLKTFLSDFLEGSHVWHLRNERQDGRQDGHLP